MARAIRGGAAVEAGHALALELWDSGVHEARILAALVDERQVGKRGPGLRRRAAAVTRRLAASEDPAARWVGRNVLGELTSEAVRWRLDRRGQPRTRASTAPSGRTR